MAQEEEVNGAVLRRWISAGDLIVLFSSLIGIGVSYGTLATRLDAVTDAMQMMQNREITPGAERRIAVLEAQMQQNRIDNLDRYRRIETQLDRIEAKLDSHLQSGNGGGVHP